MARYLNLLTSSIPIESTLGASSSVLADHLNAEIVSGTVSSVGDGVTWLSYTFLSVRMAQNPLVYGITWDEVNSDPQLHSRRTTLVEQAARALDDARMCRYDPRTGALAPTDLGRVSSHFYVSHRTVVLWNELFAKLAESSAGMTDEAWEEMDATVLHAVSCASEFEQMRPRQEEADELDELANDGCCVRLKASADSREGKVNILLQSYISRSRIRISDLSYVVQSSTRLLRALFEVALRRGLPSLSLSALELARASESRVWPFQHPLWQLCHGPGVKATHAMVQAEIVSRLESAGPEGELHSLRKMSNNELTDLLGSPRYAQSVQRAVSAVPTLDIVSASVVPVTRTILSVKVTLFPTFRWKDVVHGNAESWWLWVEDHEHERIYHSERIMLTKRQVLELQREKSTADTNDPEAILGMTLKLTVPVFDPPSSQYWIRVESERWHTGGGVSAALSLQNLALPQREPPHSELLDLRPLSVCKVLKAEYSAMYASSFTHLNPIQTQVFHSVYHTDANMLVGAPTGSGKTVIAELAILRALEGDPKKCVVYIAPLKALVRERVRDWKRRLTGGLGKSVVELTGDVGRVDGKTLETADVIVATPEKWDIVSRGWRRLKFVRNVSLIILDEVHLLGADRGPVLEVIVSRARRLSVRLEKSALTPSKLSKSESDTAAVRIVALSTALSNARELADWLGVSSATGLYNFRPSVRPVPCEAHVIGVAGERYTPRMQAMNRPAYTSIVRYSPTKPVLIFVSSRRQTRLTALDLMRLAAADGRPRRFLGSDDEDITSAIRHAKDPALRQTLALGVGIHHAGLTVQDRSLVEGLFSSGVIQVLVSTSTLAWGVNLPAYLVVLKGTEFFDVKQQRYVDMPITDILQMMGRAGRPQFDSQAFAVVLVHEPKKTFLKKFLYEPFPVESSLHLQLAHHLNAEIAARTISSPQDAMDYLTWTFLFRRMLMNPGFYGITPGKEDEAHNSNSHPTLSDITKACSGLVDSCIARLATSGCISVKLVPGTAGDSVSVSSSSDGSKINKDALVGNSVQSSFGRVLKLSPTHLGEVASSHYLAFKTVAHIKGAIGVDSTYSDVLQTLTKCEEFSDLPLRFNEDSLNIQYGETIAEKLVAIGEVKDRESALKVLGLRSVNNGLHSASVKAIVLLFGHIARVPAPAVDYVGDLKSILEQVWRVLQAILDISAEARFTSAVESCLLVSQSLYQAQLPNGGANAAEGRRLKMTVRQENCEDGILLSLVFEGVSFENVKTSASNIRHREAQWFVLVVDEQRPERLLAFRRFSSAILLKKAVQVRVRRLSGIRKVRVTMRNDSSFEATTNIVII